MKLVEKAAHWGSSGSWKLPCCLLNDFRSSYGRCDGWPTSQFCGAQTLTNSGPCAKPRQPGEDRPKQGGSCDFSQSRLFPAHTALVNVNVSRQTPLGMTVFGKGLRSWLKGSPSAGRNQQLHLSVVLSPRPHPTGEGSVETSKPVSKWFTIRFPSDPFVAVVS